MKILKLKQGSPEWKSARLGMITASCFQNVLCKGKSRKRYLSKLVEERLSGELQNTFTNNAMRWGIEQEKNAKKLYQRLKKKKVRNVGFIKYDSHVGCSPDGFVGKNGLVEIKCPNTSTHIQNLGRDNPPSQYVPQLQGQLWISNRQWCDFVSYDPRYTKSKIHIIRVYRDDEYITQLKIAIEKFKAEMARMLIHPKNTFIRRRYECNICGGKIKKTTVNTSGVICFWVESGLMLFGLLLSLTIVGAIIGVPLIMITKSFIKHQKIIKCCDCDYYVELSLPENNYLR